MIPPPDTPEKGIDLASYRSFDELVAAGEHLETQGRRAEARAHYEAALSRISEARSGAQASTLLRWIARTHRVDSELDLALECAGAALAVAEAFGDVGAVGHARNLQAIISTQQGDLDQAERLYHMARESAVRVGDASLAAMTAQNLAVIANIRGDLDTAQHHYEASLAAYRQLGSPNMVLITLNNLGLLHMQREQWDAAATCFDEASGVAEALGDQTARTRIEINRAEGLAAQRQFAEASAACERAEAILATVNDDSVLGELRKAKGIIARETGDYGTAERCLQEAHEVATRRQDLLLLADVTKESAELHRRQGRNRDTLQALNRAHRLFTQLRARRELADVGRRMGHLEGDFLDVVRKWGESIECKDDYTQGHCERVADLACALAARAGLDEQSLFWFRIGALLHDVGKLVIPPDVLNKPGALTPDEWALVRRHPSAGVEMLADVDFPWDVRPLVESHHERWDGRGYPHGLQGESIPLTARILCIADVYDALTSERSYKKPLSHADALDVMRSDVGTQFDPDLFTLFEAVAGEMAAMSTRPAVPALPRLAATGSGAAIPDELTGLPLRRAFVDAARSALALRGRGESVALLVLDVDHFKLINDTYGHLQGDAVLRAVADMLRQHLPEGGFVGRYAGDEFVMLLPNTSRADAAVLAERLRVGAHAIPVESGRRNPVALTISVGIAAVESGGSTMEMLFSAADAALYEAKRRGRDAVAGEEDAPASMPAPQLERFTGRVEEKRRLTQLLQHATRGEPQIVAVVGEAGIGKTALVRELGPEVRLRGGSMAVGRCMDGDTRPPYAPWASVLNAIRVLRVVPDRAWSELPHLLPSLGTVPVEGEGTRFALFEEVAEYLHMAAVSRPIVVLLDDMQWSDGPSWDLLEYLAARLDRERLLICLTLRDEDMRDGILARRYRLSRDERFHEVRVGRLSRDEVKQWLYGTLQQEPPEALLEFMQKHGEGNPFVSVQVLRALREEGSLSWTQTGWEWRPNARLTLPTAARDLLARRLARLSPSATRTLASASVLGRSIDLDIVIAAGLATEDALLDAVEEGLAASVLEPAGAGSERVSFTHGLLAQLLQEGMHVRRLRRLHERVADALAARPGSSPAEIAAHYDTARVTEKAYRYAILAAERAAAVHAQTEAASFLALAKRHAAPGAEQADVEFRLMETMELLGRLQEAERHCTQALAWYDGAPSSVRRAECRRAHLRIKALLGQTPHDTCAAVQGLLDEADRAGLPSERIALLAMLSHARHLQGDVDAAESLARDCVRLATPHGDAKLTATALLRLGNAVLQRDPLAALAQYEQAAALFGAQNDLRGLIRTDLNVGAAYAFLTRMGPAREAFERALERSRITHSLDFTGVAALNLGVLALRGGRHESARTHLKQALEMLRRVEHDAHSLSAQYNLAHLAREEGNFADALAGYQATLTAARTAGLFDIEMGSTAGAGLCALSLGDVTSARMHVARLAVGLDLREGGWFQGRELADLLRLRLMIRAGDVAGARAYFDEAVARSAAHDAFAAAWLAVEFAGSLEPGARDEGLIRIIRQHAVRADELGLELLAPRYGALLHDQIEVSRKPRSEGSMADGPESPDRIRSA